MNQAHYVISAVGKNRTGIVADVSEVIFDSDCNIEDSQMSLLGDQFALLTLVSAADTVDLSVLSDGCDRLMDEKGIRAAVFPVDARRCHIRHETRPANYKMQVVGTDRSGIVCKTSRVLALGEVDILDLTTHTRCAPQSGSPVFTMDAQLDIPAHADVDALKQNLSTLSDELVVEISLRPVA